MMRHLSLHREQWPLKAPFRITGKTWVNLDVVVVELRQSGRTGRGEAAGVFFLDETAETIFDQIVAVTQEIEAGADRRVLMDLLPPGGARNAVDCALWDLESQLMGSPVWERLRLRASPLTTVMTIGVRDTPEQMALAAREFAAYPVLKIKLDAETPVERIEAIRRARPDATLVVDANQGFDIDLLREVLPAFHRLGVAMVEQPLARGADAALEGFRSPIPLCADESCLDVGDLATAVARYQMINIKLDKTGGLTAALELAHAAKAMGLPLMVGNMFGTSLAMAPAFLVGQMCRFVDLDGPLSLTHDRPNAMTFNGPTISLPERPVWGAGGSAFKDAA